MFYVKYPKIFRSFWGCSSLFVLFFLPFKGVEVSHAAFFEDSKTTLNFRNFYINRNYLDDTQSKGQEWAQSFILNYHSGDTEGPVGFGLDILALHSQKLNGGRGTTGTGMMPVHDDGRPADHFGRLALSGRLKFSKTELRIGEWQLIVPVFRSDDGRSLPQTAQAAMVTSNEIDNLSLYAGQVWANSPRDDSSMGHMTLGGMPKATSDKFNFGGLEYLFDNKRTVFNAWYAQLKDVYAQRFFKLQHTQLINNDISISGYLNFFDGEDDGDSRAGHLSNHTLGGMFWIKNKAHTVYYGFQKVTSDTAWMQVNGTSGGSLVNDSYNGGYANAREKSWQLRYDYNFVGLGIPGLTWSNKYISGRNIKIGTERNLEEWGRESVLAYVVQSGQLKDLNIRWVNASIRRDWGGRNRYDDNRIIINFPISLF